MSGTVGVGNVAHVAIAVSIGGPGAAFWLFLAGFLGMSTKFVECTLGVKYRRVHADGSVSGGPMFDLDQGLAARAWPRVGRILAVFYAVCIVVGCIGVGAMFQANQAFVAFVSATGGDQSFAVGSGWVFGVGLAVLTGLVIVGGIKSIGRTTSALVPAMLLLYFAMAVVVIGAHYDRIPWAISTIVSSAFSPQGVAGGALAVATLEPFIDTMVVCMLTALMIVVAGDPGAQGTGIAAGVEMTSQVVGDVVSWFPGVLALVIFLFAFSTMISWSYYGLEGCVYLFGPDRRVKLMFNVVVCAFAVVGCATQLSAILDFSDAMVFAMAFANIIGLYVMAPVVKRELDAYWRSSASR